MSSAAKHQDEWLNPGPPFYRQGASALYFGGFGDQPITGDWDDSGIDTMAVVRWTMEPTAVFTASYLR